jgi:3-polyprenyl-4-hydroxybenzoate decarboxylase
MVQHLFVAHFQRLLPELVDFAFPSFTTESMAVVAIQKSCAGQAQKVANLLWGLGVWPDVRVIMAVDANVDISDKLLMSSMLAAADFERDLSMYQGPASARERILTGRANQVRWAIDATQPLPGEPTRQRGTMAKLDAAAIALVERRWGEYGLP